MVRYLDGNEQKQHEKPGAARNDSPGTRVGQSQRGHQGEQFMSHAIVRPGGDSSKSDGRCSTKARPAGTNFMASALC